MNMRKQLADLGSEIRKEEQHIAASALQIAVAINAGATEDAVGFALAMRNEAEGTPLDYIVFPEGESR